MSVRGTRERTDPEDLVAVQPEDCGRPVGDGFRGLVPAAAPGDEDSAYL